MKPPRVECDQCQNFIEPVYGSRNFLEKPRAKAKCKLGKRVMFRVPNYSNPWNHVSINDFGYIRYCNEFKLNQCQQ